MTITDGTDELALGEAGPDDLGEVKAVLQAANAEYRSSLAPPAFEAYLAMVLDLETRLGAAQVIIARRGPELVGTVTFFPDARDEGWGGDAGWAGIRSMGVAPAARGLGVGGTLVDECVRRAHATGARGMALHTAEWLPDAIRLYERRGFVRAPERDLAATAVMPVDPAFDFMALAFVLDLGSPAA